MLHWLILDSVAQDIRERAKALPVPTVEQFKAWTDQCEAARSNGPRNLTIAGDVAELRVEGVLTKKPDFFMSLFYGNTSYEDIVAAVAKANADPSIKRIQMVVDSPGGAVDGMFEALAALDGSTKPINVRASLAASAAYALAAVASRHGKLTAVDASSMFGSVGVVASYVFWSDVERIDVTSTEAPDKRPDARTEEGRATIRAQLDAIHDLMVDGIAVGRGTTKATVNETFGRGGVFLAEEAKKRKMIDAIATPALRAVKKRAEDEAPAEAVAEDEGAQQQPAAVAASERKSSMDINTLKAQHPDVYNAVFNAGSEAGGAKERDRVTAHLIRGQAAGPGGMKIALDAIEKGAEMSETLRAKYDTAARNADDVEARGDETAAAVKAVVGGQSPEAAGDIGDAVVAAMRAGKAKKGGA